MARLNVAVEAAIAAHGESPTTVLSIYVTIENHEPVIGLTQKDFTTRWLQPTNIVPGDEFDFYDLTHLLPGVYQLRIRSDGKAYGNTIGVTVRMKRKSSPRRSGGGEQAGNDQSGTKPPRPKMYGGGEPIPDGYIRHPVPFPGREPGWIVMPIDIDERDVRIIEATITYLRTLAEVAAEEVDE